MDCAEGERLHPVISRLQFHFGKINTPAVDPWGRAGFEPPQRQPQRAQIVRQPYAGVHPVGAGGNDAFAGDHRAVKVGACGNHHCFGGVLRPQLGAHPGHCPVFREDFHNLSLFQLQILLQFQNVLHVLLIFPAVGLCPQGVDSGAFALIQHPVLDAAVIRRHTHLAAQGVQLPHQMALAGAADGGVAGHIAHGVQIDGKEDGMQPQPGGGQRGLDARVTRTDDGHVTASSIVCCHKFLTFRTNPAPFRRRSGSFPH